MPASPAIQDQPVLGAVKVVPPQGLAALRGLHLMDSACALAVTWQLQGSGTKARSTQFECPRFQGNPELQVYEIKSVESAPRALPELEDYIELLGSFQIPGFGHFMPGSPANPGAEGEIDWPGGGRLVWCCPWPGAIIYDIADQTDHICLPNGSGRP
jgi:hypothetical protein